MTWTQLDDRWDIGSKMVRAFGRMGDAAPCMWSRAVTHANREHTDGVVHVDVLRTLTKHRRPDAVVACLVDVGALHDEAGRGACSKCSEKYQPIGADERVIHDFLDWNPSKSDVAAKRRAKQEAGRKGGAASGATRTANQKASEQPTMVRQHPSEPEARASVLVKQNEPLSSPSPSPSPSASSKQSGGEPPPTAEEILAELRKHPALDLVASAKFADGLAGRLMARSRPLAWVAEAIAEAAVEASATDLGAEALARKVRVFVDNAKPPRDEPPARVDVGHDETSADRSAAALRAKARLAGAPT